MNKQIRSIVLDDTGKIYPRVLVVSHETFSTNTSMGRTLSSYFRDWDKDCIAQLYIQSEVPTSPVCSNYYKYTDVDALKSLIIRKKVGIILSEDDVDVDRDDAADAGRLSNVYNLGSKKLPLTYILRDWMWKHSTWHSAHLSGWLRNFRPEIVFFAAGDYIFSNEIAMDIAEELGVPLVTCCMDDYYLYNLNESSLLGRIRQEYFMRSVDRLLKRSSFVFTISELMAKDYSDRFEKDCRVLYTASSFDAGYAGDPDKRGISYLGGLEYDRNIQLATIGEVLREASDGMIPDHVDVYSGSSAELSAIFREKNGVAFHNAVSSQEVSRIIAGSMAVIHTESFDKRYRRLVRYSVSTKIPDCLASGTCILAYGPRDVASIRYLEEHDAAFVAETREELIRCIYDIFHNEELRNKKVKNAVSLAEMNHDSHAIPEYIRRNLLEAVRSFRDHNNTVVEL